jgi:NAD(P)-dependent dehydrogenase (short-subunit alcohol dehydrogenase family)
MGTQKERIAFVTGGSKGIGKEVVRCLAQQGVVVVIGARSVEAGERTAAELSSEGTVLFHPFDVTDENSRQQGAKYVERQFGKLDILINNAGIATDGPPGTGERRHPSQVSISEIKAVYETNVFGVIGTIQAFLPLLRQAPAGRIVNVSSGLGILSTDRDLFNIAYSSSKTALNAVTRHFACEFQGSSVAINSAAPGFCATDLNGFTGPRTPAQGATIIVRLALLGDDSPNGGFFNEDGPLPW